jgi:hypothetical protein
MNVPQSIGDIWEGQRSLYEKLRAAIEPLIGGHLHKEWHFVDRVKGQESFAQKVETGRVSDPRQMEDFYACTVVVKNMAEVADAEIMIRNIFDFVARRPPSAAETRLEPHSFDFDHLRLYKDRCRRSDR